MKQILKLTLTVDEEYRTYQVPGKFLRALCVQLQNGQPVMWVEVEPAEAPNFNYSALDIIAVATGEAVDLSRGAEYAGTVQFGAGHYVLHFYVRPR